MLAETRTVSFAEYIDALEAKKAELGTSSDFEGMRAQYHQETRRALCKFIEEVDELIPWEPGEDPWQHLEEVPGGWENDWLKNISANSEVSNPYNVRVEVEGKILFIPYRQEQYATLRHNLVNKDVRVKVSIWGNDHRTSSFFRGAGACSSLQI